MARFSIGRHVCATPANPNWPDVYGIVCRESEDGRGPFIEIKTSDGIRERFSPESVQADPDFEEE